MGQSPQPAGRQEQSPPGGARAPDAAEMASDTVVVAYDGSLQSARALYAAVASVLGPEA